MTADRTKAGIAVSALDLRDLLRERRSMEGERK
jgi:hypothetical protein